MACDMCDVFKNEMSLEKLAHWYYNWQRRNNSDEEKKRTNRVDPPTEHYLCNKIGTIVPHSNEQLRIDAKFER